MPIVKTAQLFEYSSMDVAELNLTRSERKTLQKFNDSIRKKTGNDAITISFEKLVTNSFVGIVQIGKTRLEILPKLFDPLKQIAEPRNEQASMRDSRRNLFSMLSFSGLIPLYKSEMSAYDQEKDFFEYLVSLFLKDLEKALIAQLNREYIVVEDELHVVRGKINLNNEILKLPIKKHVFCCIYDEFSPDNVLNQILKTSLKKIREISKYDENRKRADSLSTMMDEVSEKIITPHDFSRVQLTRLNENYRGILEFCSLILFGNTYSPEIGEKKFYAILFDMNFVYERYVTKLLRNTFPETYQFHYQELIRLASDAKETALTERRKRELYPDIIVKTVDQSISKNVGIIDTKYKLSLARDRGISNADIYQMIAYCISSDTDLAILLYPQLPNQENPRELDYWVNLDKLVSTDHKIESEGNERIVHLAARCIHIFSDDGKKILRHLHETDKIVVQNLLMS